MASAPIYKIMFLNQGEMYEIYARQVYQSDLWGFLEAEEFVFGERSQMIVDPAEEKLKTEFASVKRSFIPLHAVVRIDEVEKDTTLIYSFEDYLHSNDLDIFMKGERNYLDMKDMLYELDSTSVQIQGALDILDSYFEQIAFNQFDKEKQKLNHYLLVEFADFFNGEEGRIKISSRKDKDIQKALSILNDPVAYERIFLPQ